ncbi:PREDICTED: LOW QUALITY PROTEIN: transcription factor HES-1-like [Tauraco erythrolophus]|uniref:LOW QUALITY PROTEIN: transcription factor HES-1-like n=1 Tax=Tauraco erythrolophus TaxID=121530 RepID=UPI0005235E9B|nr:PREDICTED: LOW QUALITY PROTEIN: transcription factor HES-1-like [Tauraco erythrolophus]
MTVKHLRNLQRAQMTAALSADPTVLGKYRAGFNECMNEVTRFLSTCEGVNTDCKLNPAEALSPKVYGGFQLVPATDGQFAFLIPNPAFPPSSGPVIPLYANANVPVSAGSGSGDGRHPVSIPGPGVDIIWGQIVPASQAGSPIGERSESVWRPW